MNPETAEQITLFVGQDMPEAQLYRWASGIVAVYSACCPGKATANEDAAALIPLDQDRGVLAVADGFGGQPVGDQASRLAITELKNAVEESVAGGAEVRDGILNGFERANGAVCALGVGAATTLTAIEVDRDRARPYHVGDSAVLVTGQRGKVKLQTVCHSPVGMAVEAGWLEESEAMHHEDRHLVSNLVGSPEMRIEIGAVLALRARDTLLVASDGLFDNLHLDEIVDCVRTGPLAAAITRLTEACRARMTAPADGRPSKPDDLTAILFRLEGPAGR
jgi:serine/threonine protein phosphatase PrpC